MDINFDFPLPILPFIAIVFVFMLLEHSKSRHPKLNLPPGPRKWPLIGSLHLLAGSDPPQRTLRNLAKTYGPLMHLQLGEVDNIVVSSPTTAKLFLQTHDLLFASRPSLVSTEISCYNNTDIAFAPYGEYWRQLRKICTLELLSSKRVKSFRPIRQEEVLQLCRWMADQKVGSSINLREKISLMNYDIMAMATLGKKTDEQAMFVETVKKSVEFFSVFHLAEVYPSIRFFHLISGYRRKVQQLHQQSDRMIVKIIEERRRATAAGRREEEQEDLLDVLHKFQDDGSLQLPLTNDNVKAILVEMFGAGTETSTFVFEWTMAELLKNPNVLKKAQDEVRRVFDTKNQQVNERYFDELKYLRLVIKETLRLHPPAPLLLPRECRERCEINGYEIPARTRVLVNVWAMGRDPEYWEEAERFEPERFMKKTVDFRGDSFEFIPFGAGRKMCPGITFGLANVELPLAMFLYHFDWILPDGMKAEELDMTELNGVEPRRKHDLCAIPVLRRLLPSPIK